MNGDQLGLLAKAGPRLRVPADFDRAQTWQTRGPAALACATGLTMADLGRLAWSGEGDYVMSSSDMIKALGKVGHQAREMPSTWPMFGLALVLWDGPWVGSRIKAIWLAVNRDDPMSGGEAFDATVAKVLFLDFWRRGYAFDLSRQLDERATGGWSLAVGIEITTIAR